MTNQFHHREMFSPLTYNLEKRYERALLFIYTQHTIIHYGNNNNSTTASHSDCFSSPLCLFYLFSHTKIRFSFFFWSVSAYLHSTIARDLISSSHEVYCVTYARTLKNFIYEREKMWIEMNKKIFSCPHEGRIAMGWSHFLNFMKFALLFIYLVNF